MTSKEPSVHFQTGTQWKIIFKQSGRSFSNRDTVEDHFQTMTQWKIIFKQRQNRGSMLLLKLIKTKRSKLISKTMTILGLPWHKQHMSHESMTVTDIQQHHKKPVIR